MRTDPLPMTEPTAGTDAASQKRRRAFRLTSRVFWDLAVYMVGLGLVMGVIFPPFVTLLGVPQTYAGRPVFIAACLAAGLRPSTSSHPSEGEGLLKHRAMLSIRDAWK